MNAAVHLAESRGLDQYERAALRRELSRWGTWMDRQAAYNGFPSMESAYKAWFGPGGQNHSSKVLMLDLPADVWTLHNKISPMPEMDRLVLLTLYASIVMPDGQLLPFKYRCERIGMTESDVKAAHTRLLMGLAGIC